MKIEKPNNTIRIFPILISHHLLLLIPLAIPALQWFRQITLPNADSCLGKERFSLDRGIY